MNFRISHWVRSLAILGLLVGVFFVYTAHPAPAMAAGPEPYTVYAPFGCDLNVPGDCSEVGSGQLVRSARGVTMNLQTTQLDPGATYTVWWIVFNNPDACEGPCNGPDLFNPDVNGVVLYAAGHVIGSDGIGNFAGHLAEGDTSGDSPPAPFPGLDDGLVDASIAEIHLVVRTHGEPIPGLLSEQIQTFLGGCSVNFCDDQQFALPN